MAGSEEAALAFAYPRFKEGEFGARFFMGLVDDFGDGSVTWSREGRFSLVRLGDGFRALYQVCTHLGCLVRQMDFGYACPCHGPDAAGGVLGPSLISAQVTDTTMTFPGRRSPTGAAERSCPCGAACSALRTSRT